MRLDQAATRLLTAATATLTTPPARRYVTVGIPAWDCEQLVVFLERSFTGQPGSEVNYSSPQCPIRLSAAFGIELVRCAPEVSEDGTPTSAASMDADALTFMAEMDSLWRGLNDQARALARDENLHVGFSPMVTLGADGAYWGGRVTATLELM